MLRSSRNNRNGKNNKIPNNRPLGVEKLEGRVLMAQLAFGTPVNLGAGVNTFDHEEGPTVTADGLNLMFARYVNGANGPHLGIFEAAHNSTAGAFGIAFSAGFNVDVPKGPSISEDGLKLLFSGSISERLYQATRAQRNEPFSDVQSMGIEDLLPGQELESPSLSTDGKTLYFTAWDTSHIQNDIYQATRDPTSDPWGNVMKLDSEINTPGYNDAQPSLSSDGLMLFFNSPRPGGFGGHDLYVSTRSSVNATWGNAVSLGPQLNTQYDEKGPFVSVDGSQLYDASTDRTYEYQADGIATDGYQLTLGNTQPRGAASTIAGDKVWVVDANKKVYVYNNSGTILGSGWSAGSLQSSSIAELQGITTHGTDVWLVEDTFSTKKNDKIYRYNGAALRISGNQNMSSSFSLNSANRNPTDLVTDGTSIWVLNNTSTTDTVFKYRVSDGAFLGSWTITGGGGSPTGITLDPSNASNATMDMWIVDNSSDRVYQLPGARNTTASSIAASELFVLASLNNTNPQGIADPPPPSLNLKIASLADDGDNTLAVSAIARGFMQAPIVSLGGLSTERVASLQSNVDVTKSVDETMSQLTSWWPVAPISVTKVQSTPLLSRTRFAEDQSIDLAIADEELNDSLHAIANDLLESTLR